MLAVGIDWATSSHTVVLMTKPGEVLARFTFENSLDGYLHLLDRIRHYAANLHIEEVAFAIESRHLRLVDFLLANNFTGYLVDPNRMEGYRQRYRSSGAKSDDCDAFVLADVLLKDRDQLTLIKAECETVQRLKLLLADRAAFVDSQTVSTNRLRTCLREYYPAVLEMFADPTGPTALAFLETYPSLTRTKDLDAEQLRRFLKDHHAFRKQRLVAMLGILTKPAIPTPAVIVEVKQKTMLGLVEQLRGVQKTLASFDAEIQALITSNSEIKRFDGLPGAGPIISGTLYVLFGEDRSRYHDASEVQSYVGVAPRTVQSGNYRAVGFRFGCHQGYRAILTRWAFSCLRRCQWAKRYYERKRKEGKGHYHALRCLANVLLKIAFTMWRDRTDYEENTYLAQVARHRMNNEPSTGSA
jgi:transposase